jgi:hypothetical protein
LSDTTEPGEGDRRASPVRERGRGEAKAASGTDRTPHDAIRRLEKRLTEAEERIAELERELRLMGPRKAEERSMLKHVLLQGVRDELADVLAELKADRQMADAGGASPSSTLEGDTVGEDPTPTGDSSAIEENAGVMTASKGALEDRVLLEQLVEKLDSAREARENIYDFIFRLLIRLEINTARTKLMFLVQRYEVDLALFDELDMMETSVNNRYINTEELNLRWKIFEERVKAEIERLRSD